MAYKDGEIKIIPVDPMDPHVGLLFPFLLQRMLDFAKIHYEEISPEAQVRDFGMRAMGKDRNLLIQAFLTPQGKLIGHTVSYIQEFAGKTWLYVAQCKVDEPGGDVIDRAIEAGEQFARERGATLLMFATKRSDSAWMKAYGFKTIRHLMVKELTNGKGDS
jgi:hypothetical protein